MGPYRTQSPRPHETSRHFDYDVLHELAPGKLGSVCLARTRNDLGVARVVAIKRLHSFLKTDEPSRTRFLESARLGRAIDHPNVVATIHVVEEGDLPFSVMDYAAGESLARLVPDAPERLSPRLALGIFCQVLAGLHAVHETRSGSGEPLGIVHRDVRTRNMHVGVDGLVRLHDFDAATPTGPAHQASTHALLIRPKLDYTFIAPETLNGPAIDRRADVYSAAATLWTVLTGALLFGSERDLEILDRKERGEIAPPSSVADLPDGIDAVVMKGLSRSPEDRWSSAKEMALALEGVLAIAPADEIGSWVRATAGESLVRRIEIARLAEEHR